RTGLRPGDRDVRWKPAQHHQGADHGQRISGKRIAGLAGGDRVRLRAGWIFQERCRLALHGGRKMADVTYYVAMPFLQDDTGSPVAGAAEECQSSSGALRRAELLSRVPGS